MPREIEKFEFVEDDLGPLVERMVWLTASRDGWMNLMPGVPSELVEGEPRPSVLSALFGSVTVPVSMATWMPPGVKRRRSTDVTLGIMHERGRSAVQQLRGFGVEVPPTWRVRQDNRRGLILAVPAVAEHLEVARWALRATESLAAVPLTGRWQAAVYRPRSTTS